MADLSTLIRLHKHELDEKRLALGQWYTAEAELDRRRRAFERDFEKEREAVAVTGDIHFTFARYAEQAKIQRQQFEELKAAMQQKIADAKDSMMETFSELKKFEMTQAERDRLEAEERAVRESKAMDDIGLEGFRRKREEP